MFSLAIIQRNAVKSGHHQHKHVAILTRGGRIVALGVNHDEIHAEIAAIRKVWPNKRAGLVLWSFRMRKDGTLGMAMPCPNCRKSLVEAGITKVHYSSLDGSIQELKLS